MLFRLGARRSRAGTNFPLHRDTQWSEKQFYVLFRTHPRNSEESIAQNPRRRIIDRRILMHSANCSSQCLSETGLCILLPAQQDFEEMVLDVHAISYTVNSSLFVSPFLFVFWLGHPESAPRPVQEDDLPVSDVHARRYVDPG